MTRIKRLTFAVPLFGVALLSFACSGSPNPSPPDQAGEPPPAKRSAEALAKEWTFSPEKDQKLQSYGSFATKSGENLVVATRGCRTRARPGNGWPGRPRSTP